MAVEWQGWRFGCLGIQNPYMGGQYVWTGTTEEDDVEYDYFKEPDGPWWLWYSPGMGGWIVANTFPDDPRPGDPINDPYWKNFTEWPFGAYYPLANNTGIGYMKPEDTTYNPWHEWGRFKNWLVRSGDSKKMDGQAFHMRTNVPPEYGSATPLELPDPFVSLPGLVDLSCMWWPDKDVAWLNILSDADWMGDATSGLSIFQIHPKASETSYERRHTRICASYSPYFTNSTVGACYKFYPQFEVDDPRGLRVFGRVYYRCDITNLGGPISSADYHEWP